VREEAVHPGSLRGGGAANAEARADAFDGTSGVVVEIVVSGFLWIAGPEVDIGLVPDFEIPLCDLVDAVALDEMAREILDELLPLVTVFRRGNVLLVPEGMKGAGSEASFFGMKLSSMKGRT